MKKIILFVIISILMVLKLTSCYKHKILQPLFSATPEISKQNGMFICSYSINVQSYKSNDIVKVGEAFTEYSYGFANCHTDSLKKTGCHGQLVFWVDCKDMDCCYATGFHKQNGGFVIFCDSLKFPEKVETYIIRTNEPYGGAEYQGNAFTDTSTKWNDSDSVIAKVILKKEI